MKQRGLRVTVRDLLDMLASGMTDDEILQDYPYLEKADFPAACAHASISDGKAPRVEAPALQATRQPEQGLSR